MEGDTIVALGTPPGESGIAVVRMSGPRAVDILCALSRGVPRKVSGRPSLTVLKDSAEEPIDEAMVSVMASPASYTGEDMVEISCHGSMQVVGDLLEEVVRLGGRIAAPGEFTKRAFLNGKLDLAQAEAVADLISSETKLQRRVAFEQLEGGLSRRARELEERLLGELSLIEVSIDFCEEDIPVRSPEDTRETARVIRDAIAHLLESEIAGTKLRRGINVTIVGRRNVGKSSLYNALVGEERAIVSSVPGTTRDILRERIHIKGFTCRLEDTAGLAETRCEIEAKGIAIGREAAHKADLVVFVVDGSEGLPGDVAEEISRMDRGRLICVLNKEDLGLKCSPEKAAAVLGVDAIAVSAIEGSGLERLREKIYDAALKGDAGEIARERVVVNSRQAAALREADDALERLMRLIDEGAQPELLSLETRAATDALGKITGRIVSDDILNVIFSRFCVGK